MQALASTKGHINHYQMKTYNEWKLKQVQSITINPASTMGNQSFLWKRVGDPTLTRFWNLGLMELELKWHLLDISKTIRNPSQQFMDQPILCDFIIKLKLSSMSRKNNSNSCYLPEFWESRELLSPKGISLSEKLRNGTICKQPRLQPRGIL